MYPGRDSIKDIAARLFKAERGVQVATAKADAVAKEVAELPDNDALDPGNLVEIVEAAYRSVR